MAEALETAIYGVLTADKTAGSLYTTLGGRISTAYGDPGDDLPLLVFEQTGSNLTHLFGGELMYRDSYEIRIDSRWEDGVAFLAEIADTVVGLFNGTTASSAPTNFDRAEFQVETATDINRADEILVATVGITVIATQTAGL